MKPAYLLLGLLSVLLLCLQYKAWFSDVGYVAASKLQQEVIAQQQRADRMASANDELVAEVLALQSGTDAIESSARSDLGMIKQGEEFYLVPDAASGAARLP